MSQNFEFEQMLEGAVKTIRNGEVVEGKVIDVKPDEIILNIGYKSDGILTRSEYSNDPNVDLTTAVAIGDVMETKVLQVNDNDGQVILSYRRLALDRVNKRLEEAYKNHEVLTAKVVQVLDGGLSTLYDGTRIFIPASLISDTYVRNLAKYKGRELSFVLVEFKPFRRRIIGDRKQLVIAEKERRQKEALERINVGDVITGKVKNITDFGAFIDLGGADGLLHISEMSWGRIENPKKVLKAGQEATVFVKGIKGTRVALSMKFPDQNPWNDAAKKYAPGSIVTGKVARMTGFGAFVELTPGVDALLHVSQISKEHVDKPSDVLSIGQEIKALVVDFNQAARRISLSIRALRKFMPEELEDEAVTEEAAEETIEEAVEEIVEEAAEEAVEEAAEEIAEEAAEEAVEEAIEEAAEEAAEEAVEEAIEEIAEEAVEEAIEEAVEEAVEEAIEEAVEEAIEGAVEEAIEEAAEEAIEEAVGEVIEEAAEEAVEEAVEEIVEAAVEEAVEEAAEEAVEEAIEEAAEEAAE